MLGWLVDPYFITLYAIGEVQLGTRCLPTLRYYRVTPPCSSACRLQGLFFFFFFLPFFSSFDRFISLERCVP